MPDKDTYVIGNSVPADEVPNWARRQPKWLDLIERVLALKPGESLIGTFADAKAAKCS